MSTLRSLSPEELEAALIQLGEKKFRANQILQWIYKKNVQSYDEMTDLSLRLRKKLSDTLPLVPISPTQEYCAQDGTLKMAYSLDGGVVESVLIPTPKRLSLCISSELGCRFNCAFCRTGRLGFSRSLSSGEILAQVHSAQHIARLRMQRDISNIIFMGMGEPLNNLQAVLEALRILLDRRCFDFSRRKITLSSVGHVPGINALGASGLGINLAISLHAANDTLRSKLMPANREWNLASLFNALRNYPLDNRQRITFEYILIKDLNHSPKDAAMLVKLLHGLPSKVNLIPFNPFEGCNFTRPSEAEIQTFRDILLSKGVATSLRQSRGSETLSACGQLGQLKETLAFDEMDDDETKSSPLIE